MMPEDPPIEIKEGFSQYAVLLKPHRSLPTHGFTLLMTGVFLIAIGAGSLKTTADFLSDAVMKVSKSERF